MTKHEKIVVSAYSAAEIKQEDLKNVLKCIEPLGYITFDDATKIIFRSNKPKHGGQNYEDCTY